MEIKVSTSRRISFIFGVAWMALVQTFGAPPPYVPGEIVVKLKWGHEKAFLKSSKDYGIEAAKNLNISFGRFQLLYFNKYRRAMGPLLAELNRDPRVEYAEPNYIYSIYNTPTLTDPRFGELWGLLNTGKNGPAGDRGRRGADIDIVRAWPLTKGSKKIKVAIIDTGIDYTHPDLWQNLWINGAELRGEKNFDDDNNGFIDDIHGYDFTNNDGDPMDDHGHGTHCAGIVGATHNNGIGVAGVMANVSLVAIKFLSSGGNGRLSDAIQSIDYAIKLDVDILSNSWGGNEFSMALKDAIKRASQEGILFVAAAGNSNRDNDTRPHYPAAYRVANVISVAAHTDEDQLARFSSYGKGTIHVAAPGYKILSTVRGATYKAFSGTSMATPYVSGALGLLLTLEGRMGHWDLRERLLRTAVRVPAYAGKVMSGGRLSVYNLLTDTSPLASTPF